MSWAEEQPWFGCEDIILEQNQKKEFYYISIGKYVVGPFNTQREARDFFFTEIKPQIHKIKTTKTIEIVKCNIN